MKKIPILGELAAGATQRHMIKLPGAGLANDEARPVISICGAKPGPAVDDRDAFGDLGQRQGPIDG